jgi:hypothetical protein
MTPEMHSDNSGSRTHLMVSFRRRLHEQLHAHHKSDAKVNSGPLTLPARGGDEGVVVPVVVAAPSSDESYGSSNRSQQVLLPVASQLQLAASGGGVNNVVNAGGEAAALSDSQNFGEQGSSAHTGVDARQGAGGLAVHIHGHHTPSRLQHGSRADV